MLSATPDGRQDDGGPKDGSDLLDAGGQPALGEDDDQRAVAQDGRDLGVVQIQAGNGPPDQQAQQQEQQQAGQPEPAGQAHGQDRRQDDGRSLQEERCQSVEVHALAFQPVRRSSDSRRRAPSESEVLVDLARGRGAVEGVEVQAGRSTVQQLLAQRGGDLDAEVPDTVRVVGDGLEPGRRGRPGTRRRTGPRSA